MSVLFWLIAGAIAYFVHTSYRRLEYSRLKAQQILDRRRAAGIPDDDQRPFAIARSDALARIAQRRQMEELSTPTKRTKSAAKRSNSTAHGPDPELASRLAGIPGSVPGYLKINPTSSRSRTQARTQTRGGFDTPSSSSGIPTPSRGESAYRRKSLVASSSDIDAAPSAIHQSMKAERSSAKKALKRELAQVDTDDEADDDIETLVARSPSAQRALKRQHRPSPVKSDTPFRTEASAQRRDIKPSVPGQFTSEADRSDQDMHDAASDSQGPSDADDMDQDSVKDTDSTSRGKHHDAVSRDAGLGNTSEARLQSLKTAARATAKKRDVDEVDTSDSFDSVSQFDTDEDEVFLPSSSRGHQAKRTKGLTGGAGNIAAGSGMEDESTNQSLPEVAMEAFEPDARVASVSRSTGKRTADTSQDRQPGDEWVDYEGLQWRIDTHTHELQRLSDVLEWRSKYKMPKDSLHPMAKERHQVVVQKWLSKEEWEDAKAKKLLGFQEAERLAEKERLDREAEEKMRRKQEILAKIRETSSPNNRLASYLLSRKLRHQGSQSLGSADSSMADDGDVSNSLHSASAVSTDSQDGAAKPRSRRISLTAANSPKPRNSPMGSPYRQLGYPPRSRGNSASMSPLTNTSFKPS
ncbi:hypothetical protein BCV70DRAFT_196921 [Testicularia cyperi]|uniref:Uncharacterized protein n=1 Tax=Testicularia cyperi TaxID=1882483 RepID=A0A317XXQ8_9BASI|nr:hypothetical protein BCV70DRAFT_196921 [Testicularia cyperi]